MRKTQLGAAFSTAAIFTSLVGANASAAPTVQSNVCSAYNNNLVAIDAAINADAGVKAADSALRRAVLNVKRAAAAEKAARAALAKATRTQTRADDVKAKAAYRKAHAATAAAGQKLAAARARADYVRAMTWQRVQAVVDAACLTAPTGLVAAAGNGQVTLSWTSSGNVLGYHIYRNGVLLATVTSTTLNYVDDGAQNNTTYNYMIRSYVSDAESPDSSTVTAIPTAVAPTSLPAPTGLAAQAGDKTVSLTWAPVTGALSYQIWRNGAQVGTSSLPSYADNGLTDGTPYNYTVRAVNGSVVSPDSNAVRATPTAPVTSLVAPTGLAAQVGDTQITLSWVGVTGATGYQILRNGTVVGTGGSSASAYVDTGLTNGTSYTYTVRATAGTVISPDSNSVSATPKAGALAAPVGLAGTAGNNSVALTWTAVTGATGYQILRGGTQIGTSTTTSYTDTTAANGTAYTYTVRATAGATVSADSNSVSVTPKAGTTTLAAPTGLAGTAGNNSVALTWTAVTGATGYQILRGGTQIGTSTTTSYTDTTAANGTAYTYTVRATAGATVSTVSNSVTVTPTAGGTLLPAPSGLAASSTTNLNTGQLQLTWSAVTGATGYEIWADGSLLGTSTTTSYLPSVTAGSLHSFTVKATNGTASQTSNPSAALSAGDYVGSAVADIVQRQSVGNIQVTIVVTSAGSKSLTGCWATYPTASDSGGINRGAIPQLCSQALSKQPTSANAVASITNVSGATSTSPAFASSLQAALASAGM